MFTPSVLNQNKIKRSIFEPQLSPTLTNYPRHFQRLVKPTSQNSKNSKTRNSPKICTANISLTAKEKNKSGRGSKTKGIVYNKEIHNSRKKKNTNDGGNERNLIREGIERRYSLVQRR